VDLTPPKARLEARVPRYPRALGLGAILVASACSRAGEQPTVDASAPPTGSAAQSFVDPADASAEVTTPLDAAESDGASDAASDVREAGKKPVPPVTTRHFKTGGVPPPSHDMGW
jgi:hypothetical protein